MKYPTKEEILSIMDYDPFTGLFNWKIRTGKSNIGKVAGTPTHQSYIQITFNKKQYRAHRLAFIVSMGREPNGQIDHKNGIPYDNRIENLRECGPSQNGGNRTSSGTKVKNVFPCRNKWRVRIKKNNVLHHCGLYDTKEEAAEAAKEHRVRMFGEFARHS